MRAILGVLQHAQVVLGIDRKIKKVVRKTYTEKRKICLQKDEIKKQLKEKDIELVEVMFELEFFR